MVVYLGLHMDIEDVARLFELRIDFGAERERSLSIWYGGFDTIEAWLQDQGVHIRIYTTGKGYVVLGYELYSLCLADRVDKMLTVDQVLELLQTLKTRFFEDMRTLGVDLSEVKISPMEGEPVIVNNPQPYVVSWGNAW